MPKYTLYCLEDSEIFLFPGSFNPGPHMGHLAIANHIESQNKKSHVVFAISSHAYGKDKRTKEELKSISTKFNELRRSWYISNKTLLVNKPFEVEDIVNQHYPEKVKTGNINLIVGADTLCRMIDKSCYYDCEQETQRILRILSRVYKKIYCFDRPSLSKVDKDLIPEYLLKKIEFVEFDNPISSTQIRGAK